MEMNYVYVAAGIVLAVLLIILFATVVTIASVAGTIKHAMIIPPFIYPIQVLFFLLSYRQQSFLRV